MKHASSYVLVFSLSSFAAMAQTNQPLLRVPENQSDLRNHFGVSYRVGWNIRASFRNLGSAPPAAPGGLSAGVDHTYDDGYVRVDSSGNLDTGNGPETLYWGFSHPSQLLEAPGYVTMHASSPGLIASEVDGGPQHGFELSYGRDLGVLRSCRWGLETAFGFTDLTFRDTTSLNGGALTVDRFALPPGFPSSLAQWAGGPNPPGILIGATPNRQTVSVSSRLDGSLYGFRLGPYLSVPLGSRVDLVLSGGLALAVVDSEYSFTQAGLVNSGRGSATDLLPGGYLGVTLNCRLSRGLSLFAGVQYQNVGRFCQTVADKRAEIDLAASYFISAGLTFSF
jgi:hypothetical protein